MCLIYKDVNNCKYWSNTIGCYISKDTICRGEEKEKEKENEKEKNHGIHSNRVDELEG